MAHKEVLTEMQQNFVLNYINNGFNVKQAALTAGYSESYSHVHSYKLLAHPIIQKKIEKACRIVEASQNRVLQITIHDKAKKLLRIIDDILPDDGEPKREYYKDAISAMKELNKMQGDYAPDKRLNLTVDATRERLEEARKQYKDY